MLYFIEVSYKKDYGAKKAKNIKNRLESVGLKNITDALPSVIYKLEGDYWPKQITEIAQKLLADPVLETFSKVVEKPKGFYKAQVWIRDSSTDVVGESVKDAIAAMSYERPKSARVCNAFAVKGDFTKAEFETAVKKTFVNEVINKFSVEAF
jgi:phosphoribosylformylglycinamidine (FGAM) synthase PurS component